MLRATTGWNITADDWYNEIGPRMLAIQRTALLIGGPDVKWNPDLDDENPPRFYEPLPSGPAKGKTTDRARVQEDKKKYYNSLGWDERGIPTPETLKRLDIDDLDNALRNIRK